MKRIKTRIIQRKCELEPNSIHLLYEITLELFLCTNKITQTAHAAITLFNKPLDKFDSKC